MFKDFTKKLIIKFSAFRSIPYKYRMSVIRRTYPEILKDYPFETDLLGIKFSGNNCNFIDRMIYLTGAFEKHMLFFLRDSVERLQKKGLSKIVFLDVGSNVGNHSLYMSNLVNMVYAFEPFARVREQFISNISMNNIKNIIVFPFGLSNTNAILPFYAGPDTNLGAASFVSTHSEYNKLIGEFETKCGDEVIQQEKISPITLIKIDVEGFEKNVIQGSKNSIFRDRPLIIFEMSETALASFNNNESEIRAIFPHDYEFYYFSYGNYNTGKYKLANYDFNFNYKHQDVIACPNEWRDILSLQKNN